MSRTNFIPNGGFETNTTGWNIFNITAPISRDITEHLYGAASLKCVWNSGNTWDLGARTDYVAPFAAGETVTGSIWIKGVGSTIGALMTISIRGDVADHSGEPNIALTSSWQRLTVTWTNTTNQNLSVWVFSNYSPVAGDTIYFDGAQLEYGPTATAYIETDGAPVTVDEGLVNVLVPHALTRSGSW